MPYPAARENPESTPCVKKLRGSSEGVREAAKNIVPRIRPLGENECHGPLPIWPHLSIPGERQLRPAACRERPDGASRGRSREPLNDPLVTLACARRMAPGIHVRAQRGSCARPARRYATAMPQPAWEAASLRNGWLIVSRHPARAHSIRLAVLLPRLLTKLSQ